MTSKRVAGTIEYRSTRADRRGQPAAFEARYRPIGPIESPAAGSLDAFLTDRTRLFSADRRGRTWRTEIAHQAWPRQPAEAEFSVDTMAAAHDLVVPDAAPISASPPASMSGPGFRRGLDRGPASGSSAAVRILTGRAHATWRAADDPADARLVRLACQDGRNPDGIR